MVAFTDFFSENWGKTLYDLPVISLNELANYDYDVILTGVGFSKENRAPMIRDELINVYGVEPMKVDTSYSDKISLIGEKAREIYLRTFSEIVYKYNLPGNVAEGGVYRGEFSKHINKWFPDRTLYLFDTFAGFDERDVLIERSNNFSAFNSGHLGDTSLETAFAKLPHPEKVVVRKGYFPETTEGINDQFVFVNLDFDLYAPILAGLEFFYPKLIKGGAILVHDYYSDAYAGAGEAVDDFCRKNNLIPNSIGDTLSVTVTKN